MATVLDTDQQTKTFYGGDYVISTFLNGGTASLDMQNEGSSNWAPLGELGTSPQTIRVPAGGKLRLTKTGDAVVEVSA